MLVEILILEVGQELIFIANFEKLANFALVIVKDTVKLGHVLVTILTEPVFDVSLVFVLADYIFEQWLFK